MAFAQQRAAESTRPLQPTAQQGPLLPGLRGATHSRGSSLQTVIGSAIPVQPAARNPHVTPPGQQRTGQIAEAHGLAGARCNEKLDDPEVTTDIAKKLVSDYDRLLAVLDLHH